METSTDPSGPTLQRAAALDDDDHAIWLQREDLGPLGAFKWRGAQAHCAELAARGEDGVVAASTGNFAAAVAWAAQGQGLRAHVVVPESTSPAKLERLRQLGVMVHEHGATLHEAVDAARAIAKHEGLPYFEDGGSRAQLDGIGGLASELAAQQPAVVVAPVACGALAAGLALGLRRAGSDAAVVGVQARACSRFAARWHGTPAPPSRPAETIADGLADDRIVEPAFKVCHDLLADVVVVDEENLRSAIRELYLRAGVLAEAAGAAALAGLRTHPSAIPQGKTVLVVSGGNIADELAEEILGSSGSGAPVA